MQFYDWRKGVIAQLTQPYRYENARWNRVVFVPEGTRFRTEHTRRGPPENFSVPVSVIDDVHLYESNMTPSQQKLYPNANFLFEQPFQAKLLDDADASDEFFAVERLNQVYDAIPYLAQGKAINYLVQLSNKGFERPFLVQRTGDDLVRVPIDPLWYTNVARVVKVKVADFPVKGMKSRIKQNLHPEHEFRWFVHAEVERKEKIDRIGQAALYTDFRRMLSAGALSGHYHTETLRTPANSNDLVSLYAFLHDDNDLLLLRIAYGDKIIVQDLTL